MTILKSHLRRAIFPPDGSIGFSGTRFASSGSTDLDLAAAGTLDIGGLWRYNSGSAYSLAATNVGTTLEQRSVLDARGYASGPPPRTLFFDAGLGSETYNGYGLLDVSFRYGLPVWRSLEPWIEAEVFNVFNNDTQIS